MTSRFLLVPAFAFVLFSVVFAVPRDAEAVAFPEWDGVQLGAWSAPLNWDPNVAPATGDYLKFGAKSNGGRITNDLTNLSVTRLTFADRSYIIQGNPLNVSESIVVETNSGNHAIELNISGVAEILVGKGGELRLSGANTFTGQTVVDGRLEPASNTALGSIVGPTRVLPGGFLSFDGRDFGMEPIRISGAPVIGMCAIFHGPGTSILRDIQLGQGKSCFFNVGTMTYPNGIREFTAGSDLLLAGGTHIVGGSHAAQGNFRVTGGTELIWNATSPNQEIIFDPKTDTFLFTDENAPSSLRGNGTLDDLYFRGGTFGAGTGGTPGIFTMGSQLNIAESTFFAQLNSPTAGTGYSQVQAGDFVNIGPNTELDLALGFQPAAGQQFRLIENVGQILVSGTFKGLPEGATFTRAGRSWTMTYKGGDGNDVIVTALATAPVDPRPFKRVLVMLAAGF